MAKVKWGVIGAGGIARRRTIPEGLTQSAYAELVAVQDVAAPVVADLTKQYGVRGYRKEAELLADPAVQAVYIATPAQLHRKQFEMAVKAGKHVLLEKPLAPSVKDAQAMARLAKRAKVFCTEGYMMKFHPLHEQARRLVESGKLGRPVLIRGQLSCWYPPIKGAWRQTPRQGGGGSLIDMGTHVFDLMQFILKSPIVKVTALCDRMVHKYAVEDSAAVLCRFANGAHGVVESYFNVRDETCLRRLEVYGTQGGILADGTIGQGGGAMSANLLSGTGGYEASQKRGTELGYQPLEAGEYNMYRAEVDYLSLCILRRKRPTINTFEHGLQVYKVCVAAYQSGKTGRAVRV